jgi:NADH-quinone oxidoreductase subunit L
MLANAVYSLILLPLSGAIIAGLGGRFITPVTTHRLLITLLTLTCGLASYLCYHLVICQEPRVLIDCYVWLHFSGINFTISFLLDKLSAIMSLVVTFVSLMVHIYSVAYMKDEQGYQRFFSYLALFTFAMLVLVLANNFLVLFFAWEGVGLVSYLLIGFWLEMPAASAASYKAFCVNRIGDIGLLLGIALLVAYCGSLDYQTVWQAIPRLEQLNLQLLPVVGYAQVPLLTLIAVLIFFGVMAKSAQIPLHVWLPDSMVGPTPISALIHAATMVTAGIYLVARLSPIFECAPGARVMILIIGASTCLFLGLVALVATDIKKIIAYSTLSQLGYMTVALGISAYDVAIFHLLMHAFFKALLFLAAGSVITAMHHEQDVRNMGGLARYLPVTYLSFVVATLAMTAIPPLSGFYSKDMIIAATGLAHLPGASYAYFCVQIAALVTGLYSARLVCLVFHNTPRWPQTLQNQQLKESHWLILLPLVLLLVPSVIAGALLVGPMIFNVPRLLASSVVTLSANEVLTPLVAAYHGPLAMALNACADVHFYLLLLVIVLGCYCYCYAYPVWPKRFQQYFPTCYRMLVNKYGFDTFNKVVLLATVKKLANICYQLIDKHYIDGLIVQGAAKMTQSLAIVLRRCQSGYIYHYALSIIISLLVLLLCCVLM